MGVDSRGTLRIIGDTGSGVAVRVQVNDGRILLTSSERVVGDWSVSEIGIHDLPEGFAIRAEGEELVLIVEDEVGFAEEMGMAAATPRLARKVAAAHNPEPRELTEPEDPDNESHSSLVGITFALAGMLVLAGGTFLRSSPTTALRGAEASSGGPADYWSVLVFGGLLMVAVAYVVSMGRSWARIVAVLVLSGVIIVYGVMISTSEAIGSHVAAYGFIAGGVVVGVAVLFSGSLRGTG
jgi:hypothetical protein